LETHWEQGGKKVSPQPLPKKKKIGSLVVPTQPSHCSVQLLGVSKTLGHHFWLRLMAGAEFWGHSTTEHAKWSVTNVL